MRNWRTMEYSNSSSNENPREKQVLLDGLLGREFLWDRKQIEHFHEIEGKGVE